MPVANPAPDFAPHVRPGANLYTNSVIVLDAGSGQLKWYHHFTPHDGFDWDVGAPPMLFQADSGGSTGRVAVGSKDGNVYVLDRASHNVLFTTPATTISNADTVPTAQGVDVCPGPLGGVEWNGPAYSPQTKMIYVGAVDWCGHYTTTTNLPPGKPGELYMGTSYAPVTGQAKGWLTAIDANTGQVRWKFQAPEPIVAGVTPTAGGVVFNGDLDGNFYAFDAANGKVLLRYKTPGAIAGGIVTYRVRGKQYVATTSGNVSRTTFHTIGSPTLIVMALNGPATPNVIKLPPVSTTSGGSSPTEHKGEGAAKSSTTGR